MICGSYSWDGPRSAMLQDHGKKCAARSLVRAALHLWRSSKRCLQARSGRNVSRRWVVRQMPSGFSPISMRASLRST